MKVSRWRVIRRWWVESMPDFDDDFMTRDEIESAFVSEMMRCNQYYNRCLGLYF